MKKTNDPFGFQKAINFKALDDPRVLNEVAKMFEKHEIDNLTKTKMFEKIDQELSKTEEPNISYKKSVNFLKSKVKYK